MNHHPHRPGIDRLAQLLRQTLGQLRRTGLRVLDAVAQHRVIRLARFAFVLCQFSPAAGQQIVTPAGAEEGVLLRFGPHGIATR